MIDPKELMIGNLVLDVDTVHEVAGIDSTACELKNRPPSTATHTQLWEFINPIPLTEEWLEKFGFKKGSPMNPQKDWFFNGLSLEDNSKFVDNNFRYKIIGDTIKIEYVHQLQNLYFALTVGHLISITTPNNL